MAKFNLGNIFTSVSSSEFPYIFPQSVVSNDGNGLVRCLIKREYLTEEENYIFDLFLYSLEIDPQNLDNYGIATYQDEAFKSFCPVFFAKQTQEDVNQLGIKIGVSVKDISQDLFIVCECEQTTVKRGKREFEEYVYTLNGHPVTLNEILDNDGKPTGKHYISLDVSSEDGENSFVFPFLVDKTIQINPTELVKLFKTGKFIEVLREFGTGGNKLWLKSNKAFTKLFQNKTFPSEGVFFLVKNGKIKNVDYVKDGETKSFNEADWEIISTSHPELLVEYWESSSKTMSVSTLREATNIQFTTAARNNEGYTWLTLNGDYPGYALIHIKEPAKTITHSPVNICTNIDLSIGNKLKVLHSRNSDGRFDEFLKIVGEKSALGEFRSYQAFKPATTTEVQAREDVNGNWDKQQTKTLIPF